MYYTPVGVYNWELLIVVPEKVAFNSLLKLKKYYLRLELLSYTHTLTKSNNRNKYNDFLERQQDEDVKHFEVAFLI